MKILFNAGENAWGGMLHEMRKILPQHEYVANGSFSIDSLAGYDVLIPTMGQISADLLATADCLQLIQQCGAGLEGVDIGLQRHGELWLRTCRPMSRATLIPWLNWGFSS